MRSTERRIDDRLRALSGKAITARDDERQSILQELLELVHQKSERLRRRATGLLLKRGHLEPERRKL